MRKLFVLALIACIVPFAVGCKIDGLWGYEDNDPVNQTNNATNIAPNLRFPKDGNGYINANITNTDAAALRVFVKVTATKDPTGWIELAGDNTGANAIIFSLPANTTLAATDLELSNGKMQFRILTYKNDAPYIRDVVVGSITSTSTTANTFYSYAIAFQPDLQSATVVATSGTAPAAYTAANFPTSGPNETPTVTDIANSPNVYTVTGLAYSTNGTDFNILSQNPAAPTDFNNRTNLENLYVRVTFSEAVTSTDNVTFTVYADNRSTPTTKTTVTTSSNFTTTWSNDKTQVTVKVTSSVPLANDVTYAFTLARFSAVAGTKTLLLPVAGYFKP